jgi:hypothetical protein
MATKPNPFAKAPKGKEDAKKPGAAKGKAPMFQKGVAPVFKAGGKVKKGC